MAESKFYQFSTSGLVYAVESLEEAVSFLREGGFIWLNYYKPEKEDLNVLVDLLGARAGRGVRGSHGDHRNWPAIDGWAASIARHLRTLRVGE